MEANGKTKHKPSMTASPRQLQHPSPRNWIVIQAAKKRKGSRCSPSPPAPFGPATRRAVHGAAQRLRPAVRGVALFSPHELAVTLWHTLKIDPYLVIGQAVKLTTWSLRNPEPASLPNQTYLCAALIPQPCLIFRMNFKRNTALDLLPPSLPPLLPSFLHTQPPPVGERAARSLSFSFFFLGA